MRSCSTCDYATRLDKDTNPVDKDKNYKVFGYYCGIIREKFLAPLAPQECSEWDEESEDRYSKK